MSKTTYEVGGLDEYCQHLFEVASNAYPKAFDELVKQIALDLVAAVVPDTPKDTGFLREGWEVGEIKRVGNARVIEVYNNMEYADFVEYGHRIKGGSYKEGVFMLTIKLKDLQRRLPLYLKDWLANFLRTHKL